MMRPDLGCKPPFDIDPTEVAPATDGWLQPMAAFMVKGWTRSFVAVAVMLGAWEDADFREAGWGKPNCTTAQHL